MSPKRKTYTGEPRLYNIPGAAAYLGLSETRMRQLYHYPSKRTPIIEPVTHISGSPIWSESQLDEQLYLWRDNPHSHPLTRERAAERVLEIEDLKGLARVRGRALALTAAKAAIRKQKEQP